MLSSNLDKIFAKNKWPDATTIKSWEMLIGGPIAVLLKKHNHTEDFQWSKEIFRIAANSNKLSIHFTQRRRNLEGLKILNDRISKKWK